MLVGAGLVTQRTDDPTEAAEALELMVDAARRAADDAGAPTILAAADQVAVTQGSWAYPDPGRLVATRLGADDARTARFELVVPQQAILTDAAARIAAGELDVALVVGGEAKHRAQRAAVTGAEIHDTTQPDGTVPDRVVAAPSFGVHDLEILRHAVDPSTAYALIEHAIGHAAERTPAEHRDHIGALWARFAKVAANDPNAWDRSAPDAAAIVGPSTDNRMIALPYTKRCCSQWNVDMAAALVLCSVEAAERHGVPRDRWVFAHSAAISTHAVPVVQRAELQRCAGAEKAGAKALALAGLGLADLDPGFDIVDLYSCFPAAVQTYAAELGLDIGSELTVTGGMTFGGGPLNSYVLHALATMVPRLRADPACRGLSSSVSVSLTKQGFSVWSASPPRSFRHEDVTDDVAATTHPVPVDVDATGAATVASWTVVHAAGAPARAVAFCDTGDGARTIATTDDADVCAAMLEDDWIGRAVTIVEPGVLALS